MAEGIVPWVRGAEPAQYFGQTFGTAASAAAERQKLALEAMHMQAQSAQASAQLAAEKERTAAELQMKQQVMQQDYLQSQQKMLIDKMYKENTIAVRQQQLEEKKRMDDQNLAKALRQQEMMANLGPALQGATTPEQRAAVLAKAGFSGPGMASMLKQLTPQQQAPLPQWIAPNRDTGAPGYFADAKGIPHFPSAAASKGPEVLSDEAFNRDSVAKEMLGDLKSINKDIQQAKNDKARAPLLDQKNELLRRINQRRMVLDQQYGAQRTGSAPASAPDSGAGGVVATYDPKTKKFIKTATESAPAAAAPSAPTESAPAPPAAAQPAPPQASIPPQILDPNKLTFKPSGAQLTNNPVDQYLIPGVKSAFNRFMNPNPEGSRAFAYARSAEEAEAKRLYAEQHGQDFGD